MQNNPDQLNVQYETESGQANVVAKQSPRRSARDMATAASDAEPLFEPDIINQRPPVANPENDSDPDDIPNTKQDRRGIDDSFFPQERRQDPRPEMEQPRTNNPNNGYNPNTDGYNPNGPNGLGPRNNPPRRFPQQEDFAPNVIDINGVPTIVPDVNVYQHKKTLAQGMMDLALLSANANQLRYVLESYTRHPYFYVSVIFISFSLICQVAVGVGLILNSRYNVKDQKEICKANKINNMTVIGIFLITIINVFISAFGVADPQDMNA